MTLGTARSGDGRKEREGEEGGEKTEGRKEVKRGEKEGGREGREGGREGREGGREGGRERREEKRKVRVKEEEEEEPEGKMNNSLHTCKYTFTTGMHISLATGKLTLSDRLPFQDALPAWPCRGPCVWAHGSPAPDERSAPLRHQGRVAGIAL